MINISSTLKAKLLNTSIIPKVFIQIGDDDNPLSNGNLYIGNYDFEQSASIRWLSILKDFPVINDQCTINSGIAPGQKFSFSVWDINRVWETLEDEAQITIILKGLGGSGYTSVDGLGEGGFLFDYKYLSERLFKDLLDEIEDKPVCVYLSLGSQSSMLDADNVIKIKKGKIKTITVDREVISVECLDSILELNRTMPGEEHFTEKLEKDFVTPKKSESEKVPTIYGQGFFPLKWVDNKNEISGYEKYPKTETDSSTYADDENGNYFTRNNGDYPLTYTPNPAEDIIIGDSVVITHSDDSDYIEYRTILDLDIAYDKIYFGEPLNNDTGLDGGGQAETLDPDKYIVSVLSSSGVEKTKMILCGEVYNIAGALFYQNNIDKFYQREINLSIYYQDAVLQLGENADTRNFELFLNDIFYTSREENQEYLLGNKTDLTEYVQESVETEFPYRKLRSFSIFKYPYNYSNVKVMQMNKGLGLVDLDFDYIMNRLGYGAGFTAAGLVKVKTYFLSYAHKRADNISLVGTLGASDAAALDLVLRNFYTQAILYGNLTDLQSVTGYRSISEEINNSVGKWLLYDVDLLPAKEIQTVSKVIDTFYRPRVSTISEGQSSVELTYWGQYVDWDGFQGDWSTFIRDALGNPKWYGESGLLGNPKRFFAELSPYMNKDKNNANADNIKIGSKDWFTYGIIDGGKWRGNDFGANAAWEQNTGLISSSLVPGSDWSQARKMWYNGVRYKLADFSDTHSIDNPRSVLNRDRETYSEVSSDGGPDLCDCMVYLQFPNKEDVNRWKQFEREYNLDNIDRFIVSFLTNGTVSYTAGAEVLKWLGLSESKRDSRIITNSAAPDIRVVVQVAQWYRNVEISADGRYLASWQEGSLQNIYQKTSRITDSGSWASIDKALTVDRQKKIDNSNYSSLYFADSGDSDLSAAELDETTYEGNCGFSPRYQSGQAEDSNNEGQCYFTSDYDFTDREFINDLGTEYYKFVRDKLNITSLDDLSGLCIGINMRTYAKHDVQANSSSWGDRGSVYIPINTISSAKFNSLQFLAEYTPEIEEIENSFSKKLTGQIKRQHFPDFSPIDSSYVMDLSDAEYYTDGTQLKITCSDSFVSLAAYTFGNTAADYNYLYLKIYESDSPASGNYFYTIGKIYWAGGADPVYITIGMLGTPSIRYGAIEKAEIYELTDDTIVALGLPLIEKPQDIIYDILYKYCRNISINETEFLNIRSNIIRPNTVFFQIYTLTPYNLKYAIEDGKCYDVLLDCLRSGNLKMYFDNEDKATLQPIGYLNTFYPYFSVSDTLLDRQVVGEINITRSADNETYNRIEVYYNFNYVTGKYESFLIFDGKTVSRIEKNRNEDIDFNRLCYGQEILVYSNYDEGRVSYTAAREENVLSNLNDNYKYYKEVKTLKLECAGIKNWIDAWYCAYINGMTNYRRRVMIDFPMSHGGFIYMPNDIILFNEGEAGQLSKTGLDKLYYQIYKVSKDLNLDRFNTMISAVEYINIV